MRPPAGRAADRASVSRTRLAGGLTCNQRTFMPWRRRTCLTPSSGHSLGFQRISFWCSTTSRVGAVDASRLSRLGCPRTGRRSPPPGGRPARWRRPAGARRHAHGAIPGSGRRNGVLGRQGGVDHAMTKHLPDSRASWRSPTRFAITEAGRWSAASQMSSRCFDDVLLIAGVFASRALRAGSTPRRSGGVQVGGTG